MYKGGKHTDGTVSFNIKNERTWHLKYIVGDPGIFLIVQHIIMFIAIVAVKDGDGYLINLLQDTIQTILACA